MGWREGLILGYFAVAATAYALIVPAFEAPDEPDHLAYINFVSRTGTLTDQFDPARMVPVEGNQPPLYYALAAAALRAAGPPDGVVATAATRNPEHLWNGGPTYSVPLFRHPVAFRSPADRRAFYALRLASVAMGLANLAMILRLARRLATGPGPALAAGVLAATLPQYLFHCGVITNDGLANLLATVAIDAAFAAREQPLRRRHYLRLGAALGLGFLAKKTALTLVPGVLLLWGMILAANPGRRLRIAALGILPALAVAASVSGWYFLRNLRLYGDLLGTRMERVLFADVYVGRPLASAYFLTDFPEGLAQTFVGRFGWANIYLPWPVYPPLYTLLLLAALGLILRARDLGPARGRLAAAATFVLAGLAGIVHFNLSFNQATGRYLFPALGPIAVLLAEGGAWWLRLAPPGPARRRLAIALVAAAVALDLLGLQRIARTCPGAGREFLGT